MFKLAGYLCALTIFTLIWFAVLSRKFNISLTAILSLVIVLNLSGYYLRKNLK